MDRQQKQATTQYIYVDNVSGSEDSVESSHSQTRLAKHAATQALVTETSTHHLPTLETEVASAAAKQQRKQKTKRGQPGKWGNPPKDAEEGGDQPLAQEKMQRVRNGHPSDKKISYYQGALREVVDSAREALSVYLLTEDPFPMDEITRNDQRNGTESVNPKGTVRWKKKIDRFFNAALEKNEDALALDPIPMITPAIRSAIDSKQSSWHGEAFAFAIPIVEMQYGIKDHYGSYKGPIEIQQIVKQELEGDSLDWTIGKAYLASEPLGVECIFFNPCIPAIVAKTAFSKGGLCVGLLAQYRQKFNPIPLPLIAYASTLAYAVLHGYSTGYWKRGRFTAGEFRPVYRRCVDALELLNTESPQMYELLSKSMYMRCMKEAEVAGKLPQITEKKLDPSKLAIPKVPNLRINTEDFNDPWHAHHNAKDKGRANRRHDSVVDLNETQENYEHNPYDHTDEFGGHMYEDGADNHAFNPSSYLFDPQEHQLPPRPTQQPTSSMHSCHPSVAPSGHHQPTVRQPSLQPPPSSRQSSVQLHPPPSTQSRQGSVNPLPDAYNAMDNHVNEEEPQPRVSKKRSYMEAAQSSGDEGLSEPKDKQTDKQRARRRVRQRTQPAPQTPIRPPQAGPSTGTHSRVRQARPMIITTNATPAPGMSSVALNEDLEFSNVDFLQPQTSSTNKRARSPRM